eukprot:403353575
MFHCDLRADNGTTGRLECTLVFNYKAQNGGDKVVVHSKAKGQGYPSQNWNAFVERAQEAVKNNTKQ